MVFHFQRETEERWESIGAGEGNGPFAVREAFDEVHRHVSEELPAGTYRYLAPLASGERWRYFVLSEEGDFQELPSPLPP